MTRPASARRRPRRGFTRRRRRASRTRGGQARRRDARADAHRTCWTAWAEPGPPRPGCACTELLTSVPTIGPTRVATVMSELGHRRVEAVGGLGMRQRARLRNYLRPRGPRAPSRLVVLAGPTAVGKGTVSPTSARTTPTSASACRRRPGRPVRARSTACTTTSSATPSSTDDRDGRAPRVGDRAQLVSVRHAAPADRAGARRGTRGLARDRSAGCAQCPCGDARGAILVFLLPPTWEELVRRLIGGAPKTRRSRRADSRRRGSNWRRRTSSITAS